MILVPDVKSVKFGNGQCCTDKINWVFASSTDERVKREAERICKAEADGVTVYVSHGSGDGEEYSLRIEENEMKISAEGAAGAFYALQTLKALMKKNGGCIECCEIEDAPDMKYRGFYQDVTRGRIPNIDTLKRLADTLAEYKVNSLQLYVEHSFEFEEYDFCREELGYLTAAEIKELDVYCKERFIELIPSLSTFGHLYHLLQSDKYRHLCELSDYRPEGHYWGERMAHHTINPLLDESFELIKSLIDQHMAAFSSNWFNICCDETFDLGSDVNSGRDKGRLYVDFVKKLIDYCESKGKRVMMWGDIILTHPEYISEISDKVVFLNWDYGEMPDEKKAVTFEKANKTQIICPGTGSWHGFSEKLQMEEPNIINFARQGYAHGACGILNTNWGDYGNLATIDMAEYGLILGAAIGWNKKTEANDELHRFVSELHYGNRDAVEMLSVFGAFNGVTNWYGIINDNLVNKDTTEGEFENAERVYGELRDKLYGAEFRNDRIKKAFIIAAEGYMLVMKWYAKKLGFNRSCEIDFEDWLSRYVEQWNESCKQGELKEHIRVFREWEEK